MKKIIFVMACYCLACSSPGYGQDPWIVSTDKYGFDNYFGVAVANGMIGVVSAPEPLKVREVVLAGVYDYYKRGKVSNFLPNYNLLNLELSIGGEHINRWNIAEFRQELNMRNGVFTASFKYKDVANIEYAYMALRHLPHCVLMTVRVTPNKDCGIGVESILETPSALKNGQHAFYEIDKPHAYIPLWTSTAESPSGQLKIVACNSFIFDENAHEEPRIFHKVEDTDSHSARFSKSLKAGKEYSFSVIGTLISSAQTPDVLNQAERLTVYAKLEGRKRLLARHYAEWEKLWQSDIQIEGDKQAQQDVRNMLYHLYSFTRESTDLSPSPMGLSGLGYNGHVFWDSEVFMYPPLLILQPQLARSMIEYRFNRLDAARKNAAGYGYLGAMFPWESAATGVEETPVWALSGPFEHHITADVGIAAWQYYLVTGDKEWLRERGWPILKATAEFWVSRVERNSEGVYGIKNVVAADEWAENVDNNAYTNGAVIKNLLYAADAASALGIRAPSAWKTITSGIPIVKMDNGVTREHDTYRGEQIKQADVNLLAYPLGIVVETEQVQKDLKYYEVRVPEKQTPAMTQAIFSLLYSRLGKAEEARNWFSDAYIPNLNPPFRVMAESKGGTNPYFATGAGGVLQAVIMGFGGVDINPKGGVRELKTVMPPHWSKLTITGVGPDKKTIVKTN